MGAAVDHGAAHAGRGLHAAPAWDGRPCAPSSSSSWRSCLRTRRDPVSPRRARRPDHRPRVRPRVRPPARPAGTARGVRQRHARRPARPAGGARAGAAAAGGVAGRPRGALGVRRGVLGRLLRRGPLGPRRHARDRPRRRLRQGSGRRRPIAAAVRRVRRSARRDAARVVPHGGERLPAAPGLGRGLRDRGARGGRPGPTGATGSSSAGHPPAVHRHAGSGVFEVLDTVGGPALGIVPGRHFRTHTADACCPATR